MNTISPRARWFALASRIDVYQQQIKRAKLGICAAKQEQRIIERDYPETHDEPEPLPRYDENTYAPEELGR